MKFSIVLLAALTAWMAGGATAQTCDMCGDVDCDSIWTTHDGGYILDYLYNAGPAPLCDDPLWANWDYHEGLTVGDVFYNVMYIFGGGPPPYCPPNNPPWEPEVDSTSIIYYTDWIPPHTGSAVVALTIAKEPDPAILGLSLPLRIRVDGEVPTIDSVTILCAGCLDAFVKYLIDPDSGYVSIGLVPAFGDFPNQGQIAFIYLTVPEASYERSVAMEWVHLVPVQSPTPDSIVIPMIYNFPPVEPLLLPHCCITPGDVNMDGTVNIGDAVFLIQCIFVDCLGHPCEKHLDANCDGVWNVADVVYLINYIFRGGPPPCCI
jgi:hypothetical protein